MSDESNTLIPLPICVCALCGLAGHTQSTCPDRPGSAMDVLDEAA